MATKNLGLNGQWIDIFSIGDHTDSAGIVHHIDEAFLKDVVANFDSSLHEPPAVIGHPKTNDPAYAWVAAQRVHNGVLEVQFADADPAFEQMLRDKRFKKRSASFYLDPGSAPGGRVPSLQHVGFLGAKAPAVKGLRDIQFDEGQAITFEETINFDEGDSMKDDEVTSIGDRIADAIKKALGMGKDNPPPANFTEAQLDERIKTAVDAATSQFSEKVTALETKNEELTKLTQANAGASRKAEIAAFVQELGAARFPPAFKNMGAVQFMESLAGVDGKVTTISFEEKDGVKKEIKTEMPLLDWFKGFVKGIGPVIKFGEHFGNLSATGNGAEIVDPAEMNKLRAGTGTKAEIAGGAK